MNDDERTGSPLPAAASAAPVFTSLLRPPPDDAPRPASPLQDQANLPPTVSQPQPAPSPPPPAPASASKIKQSAPQSSTAPQDDWEHQSSRQPGASSKALSVVSPAVLPGGNKVPDEHDALNYLNFVRTYFEHDVPTFNEFLNIMKDFRNYDITIPQVKERVSELFKDHPALIPGFNVFLNADNVLPLRVGAPDVTNNQSPQLPQPPPQMAPPTPAPPVETKNLDVTDALSYLDLVKSQFESSPAIFNQFLDVMKDFKSSSITTPGVIHRVSKLFQGHPLLIQGFNAFLPPGYNITYSGDSNMIVVTMPSGVTHYPAGVEAPPPIQYPNIAEPSLQFVDKVTSLEIKKQSVSPGPPMAQLQPPAEPLAPKAGPVSRQERHSPPPASFPKKLSPGVSNSASNAATVLGGMSKPGDTLEKESNTDFRHAITYINRIKTRFGERQDVYKEFLQLLQSYQKEQMTMQEAYSQVAVLFKGAKDLLEEFKLFLPDPNGTREPGASTSAQPALVADPGILMGVQMDEDSFNSNRKRMETATTTKRKRRQVEKEIAGTSRAPPTKRNRVVQARAEMSSPIPGHSQQAPISPPRNVMNMSVAGPSNTIPSQNPLPTDDGPSFFEHLKRTLEDPEIYEEFLKVLQLFSMDIIDSKTLLDRLEPLFTEEQMEQFLELVGWDEEPYKPLHEEVLARGDSTARRRALSLLDKGHRFKVTHVGPSYRSTPPSEIGLACSGRDELGRNVLNDQWESHPIWASEETVFVTHKNTAFEDALHRSEEERHEYQFHIEAMARTLATLEPLLLKLEEMTPEERMIFRLPPNLGSPSPSIHQRIIKKIYGREAGLEVIQSLQEYPAHTLPVVINRLRIKDDEWRRNQREWNKTWREVDARNFHKSLDSQGITFKANDKKYTTTKAFVQQIEAARESAILQSDSVPATPQRHLHFAFRDKAVLHDTVRLCLYYLDRQSLAYANSERRGMERFLKRFITVLLEHDETKLDNPLSKLFADLEPEAQAAEGAAKSPGGEHFEKLEEMWTRRIYPAPPSQKEVPAMKRRHATFYTNTSFYVLIRLFQLLYSRLLLAKEISVSLARDESKPWQINDIAVELGINDSSWSATVATATIPPGGAPSPVHFYEFLVRTVEKLVDGDVDQISFEDCIRVHFGTQAYLLFTLDKVISALIKQVQTVMCDGRSGLDLIQEQRDNSEPSIRDLIKSRIKAQLIANTDENVYKVDLDYDSDALSVHLLRKEDPSVDLMETAETKYEVYVESYMMNHPTEGIEKQPALPYLKRNVRACELKKGEKDNVMSSCELGVHVRAEDFRLKYGATGVDVFFRVRPAPEIDKARQQAFQKRKTPFE